jgi:ferredoxin-type protein NapG
MLVGAAKAAGGACAAGVVLAAYAATADSQAAQALRPPGALPEDEFLSACVRCGLCVRACPYDTLRLATLADIAPFGTPYFVARETPCAMCPDVPCAKACPTGALDRDIPDIRAAAMGIAALVDDENCLNYHGLQCSICYRVCPIRGEAITLVEHVIDGKRRIIPTVHSESCTGCGTCEKQCVLKEPAIKVLPPELALGSPGRNAAGRPA